MTGITVAATQMACGWDLEANLRAAEGLPQAVTDDYHTRSRPAQRVSGLFHLES